MVPTKLYIVKYFVTKQSRIEIALLLVNIDIQLIKEQYASSKKIKCRAFRKSAVFFIDFY